MGTKTNKNQTAAVLSVEDNTVRCAGHWTVADLHSLEQKLPRVQWPDQATLIFDMTAVQLMDTSGAWLLSRTVHELEGRGTQVSLQGLSAGAQALFKLVREDGGAAHRLPLP